MEIISLAIGALGIVLALIPLFKKNRLSKKEAYDLVEDFRKQWDLARTRNTGVGNEELMKRGLKTIESYERKLRRANVWFSRRKTHELNELGSACERVRNLILRNHLRAESWPHASGQIGRQLRRTIAAFG